MVCLINEILYSFISWPRAWLDYRNKVCTSSFPQWQLKWKNRTQKVAQELSTCFTYAVPFPVDVIDEAVITVAIWVYEAGREDCGKCTPGQWDPLLGKVRMKRGKGWAWGAWLLFCVDSQRGRHGIFEALRKKNNSRTEVSLPWWMLSSKWAGPVKCWLHGFDQFWQMFSSMLSTPINTQVTSVILEGWLVFPSRQAFAIPFNGKKNVCLHFSQLNSDCHVLELLIRGLTLWLLLDVFWSQICETYPDCWVCVSFIPE